MHLPAAHTDIQTEEDGKMIRSEPLTALGFNFCLSASICTDWICLVTVPTGFRIANVNVDTELFFKGGQFDSSVLHWRYLTMLPRFFSQPHHHSGGAKRHLHQQHFKHFSLCADARLLFSNPPPPRLGEKMSLLL